MPIKVKIENFQSIKDIEFEIDKYTVLTGPSNSGKSAICRAIEGALFNRAGDGFVRNGEKYAQVTLITDTHEIVWTKGSGKNHYTINGEAYDKVGSDVPEIIYQMGFKDIELTRSKLRPQMGTDQFDILFLIREQGSLISEVFSVLGRLDVITKAGKECGTDLKSKKSLLKTRYDDLASIDKKLAGYQGFEKVELASESLQVDYEDILVETQGLQLISNLGIQLKESNKQLSVLSNVSRIYIPTDIDPKSINQLKGLNTAYSTLRKLHVEITALKPVSKTSVPEFDSDKMITLVKQVSSIRSNYERIIQEIRTLELLSSLGDPEGVEDSSLKQLSSVIAMHKSLEALKNEIDRNCLELNQIDVNVVKHEEELHTMLEGLDECPLCSQTLEKSYVH